VKLHVVNKNGLHLVGVGDVPKWKGPTGLGCNRYRRPGGWLRHRPVDGPTRRRNGDRGRGVRPDHDVPAPRGRRRRLDRTPCRQLRNGQSGSPPRLTAAGAGRPLRAGPGLRRTSRRTERVHMTIPMSEGAAHRMATVTIAATGGAAVLSRARQTRDPFDDVATTVSDLVRDVR
jgi:hypothetical protein